MSTKTNTQIQKKKKKENDEKDNFHKLKNNKGLSNLCVFLI